MNAILKKIALASALALAFPAMAQTFLKPQPMAAKYRDTGAKPATGRAGFAAIEARALIDVDGKTDIEVTTGRFEGIGGGGALGKVQVKLFSDGALVETDNYKLGATGGGKGTFSYDGLYVGQVAQVQANVSGIDPNRTDVVTATTQVRRRPDLEAVRLQSQPRVVVNAPVTIQGTVSEINGEMGARATCRLFADGVEIGAIPGAWVDASSAVTCLFHTSFATLGTRNLALRVTDVEPADYDASNNAVSLPIEVVSSNMDVYYAFAWELHAQTAVSDTRTHLPSGSTQVWGTVADENYQTLEAYGWRLGNLPYAGRITLRHSTGGVALPSISVAVQDLPDNGQGCGIGHFDQQFVVFCSGAGFTQLSYSRNAGFATYVTTTSSNGTYGDAYFQNTFVDGPYGEFVTLGSDYSVELLHEAEGAIHGVALSIPLERKPESRHEHRCRLIFGDQQTCIKEDSEGWEILEEAFFRN